MTDWDEIRANIDRAAQASASFQKAGEALVEVPNHEKIRDFAILMRDLNKNLRAIQRLLGAGSLAAVDEIADLLSKAIFKEPSHFRLTPEPPIRKG